MSKLNENYTSKYNKDMAIVIPACDEYIDVLTQFVKYFNYFWPDCPFEVIIVTQNKLTSFDKISSYITNSNAEWLERVVEGIKHTKCKYILTMMEDAFIAKTIKTADIFEIIDFMKKNKILYYRNPKKDYKEIKNEMKNNLNYSWSSKIRKDVAYSVSCFTDIWDRSELLRLFSEKLFSAWDIEDYFLDISSKKVSGYFEGYASDRRNFLNVIEVVNQGKWTYEVKMFNKIGIPINTGNREKAPLKSYYRKKMHVFFNSIIPRRFRKKLKIILSKLGYKFVSKN